MNRSLLVRTALVGLLAVSVGMLGCRRPSGEVGSDRASSGGAGQTQTQTQEQAPAQIATAASEDVQAAQQLLDGLGNSARYTLVADGVLTEIVIQDGSALSAENITLFGKLSDLQSLQIHNFRSLDDEMAAQLSSLENLRTLALTNSVISDATVEMIARSFPKLIDLDLSYNANMSNGAMKVIAGLGDLERLTLIQNRFDDLGTTHLAKLQKLRALDLRGNMLAGDMTLEVVGALPKLVAFKHRSTTVSDFGMEYLAQSQTLESLLMQDFGITGQAGQHIASLPRLNQLEIFRCQSFGSEGVLALAGKPLNRLTLRDLPMVDDQAMAVFADLPELKRLYLHELASVSDSGLQNLSALKSLELLDIWTVPQLTDATVEVIATLPNLKQLSIRTTGVTDDAVEKLLAMKNLQTLVFKDNGMVTAEGLEKLSSGAKFKTDVGPAEQQ